LIRPCIGGLLVVVVGLVEHLPRLHQLLELGGRRIERLLVVSLERGVARFEERLLLLLELLDELVALLVAQLLRRP
jgi:hypothetical protein